MIEVTKEKGFLVRIEHPDGKVVYNDRSTNDPDAWALYKTRAGAQRRADQHAKYPNATAKFSVVEVELTIKLT